MPTFFHIHRGIENSSLDNGFINIDNGHSGLFFSKLHSWWHNVERDVSKDYGGYREYKISFPSSLYTESFNPKIIKITKKISKNLKK